MKKFFINVINRKNKNLNWLNCNYCYVATFFIIALMLISRFCFASQFNDIVSRNYHWNIVLCSFRYSGGNFHLLGNIMGFLLVSIFLERHFGSLKYLGLVFLAIPLANIASFAFNILWNVGGFSCVEYFLYANFLLILIFNFKEYFIGKFKWIFPTIIVALIVVMMSWAWGGNGMSDVGMILFNGFNNPGHTGPFVLGILTGLFTRLFHVQTKQK